MHKVRFDSCNMLRSCNTLLTLPRRSRPCLSHAWHYSKNCLVSSISRSIIHKGSKVSWNLLLTCGKDLRVVGWACQQLLADVFHKYISLWSRREERVCFECAECNDSLISEARLLPWKLTQSTLFLYLIVQFQTDILIS